MACRRADKILKLQRIFRPPCEGCLETAGARCTARFKRRNVASILQLRINRNPSGTLFFFQLILQYLDMCLCTFTKERDSHQNSSTKYKPLFSQAIIYIYNNVMCLHYMALP